MAVKEIQSHDAVPQHPKLKTPKTHSIRSNSLPYSASSSPATGSEDSSKLEWHMCPSCKTVSGAHQSKDEKSSSSTSPTTSELSQSRSISFARLGLKIKNDLCSVFGHSQDTPSSTPEKGKVSKPKKTKKKKKPKKIIHVYDKGYEELGGDHWADEY